MGNDVKRRRWGRTVLVILLVIFVPLVIGYFVATSEPFFKGVILPKASKSLNAKITVARASIHPFSQVVLRGVKVETTGTQPLATMQEARLRYSLMDIIRGNIKVSEVTAIQPVIHIVTNPDGSSNLDPLKPKKPEKPAAQPPPEKPQKPTEKKPAKPPPQVDIGQIRIENGTLRETKLTKDGGSQETEVSNLNLTIANVQNGQSGSMDIAARLRGDLEGGVQGKLKFALTRDLQPESLTGSVNLNVDKASEALNDLAGVAANLNCDVTPTDVKQVALAFQKQGQSLGELRAYGPFSAAKQEGKLNVELLGIDRRLLSLVGAKLGMDFGDTKINSTNTIELARGGYQVNASGGLTVQGFSIIRTNEKTPAVNLTLAYGGALDRGSQVLELEKFQLDGTQNQKPLIAASLARPMSLSLGESSAGLPDSALKLTITGFSFADWKAVLGDVPSGNLNANLQLESQEASKLLALKGDAEVTGLILNDPEKQKTAKPLEARLKLDSAFRQRVVELNQVAVALTPTQLAKNEAVLKGKINLVRSNTISGTLDLASDALDLTGYYDLFGGEDKPKAPKAKKTKTKPAATTPATPRPAQHAAQAKAPPPEKKPSPFRNLVLNTKIGHVYLRELDLSNVVSTAKLDGSKIDVNPIALALNGAAVEGHAAMDDTAFDLSLKMNAVPLAPIANSFMPSYKDRAKGGLNATLQIKGDSDNLKDSLQGQINASCTNAQIQLAGKNMRRLLETVSTVLRLPELRTAPVTAFDLDTELGAAKIQVKKCDLISEAFMAQITGAISMADPLTNSAIPKLPVTFALSRSLAERGGFVTADSATNTAYIPLPNFLYLTGTLGNPDTERNDAVIAGIVAKKILPHVGGDAGKVIDSILGSGKGTNGSGTNPPPANPLDRLFKKKTK